MLWFQMFLVSHIWAFPFAHNNCQVLLLSRSNETSQQPSAPCCSHHTVGSGDSCFMTGWRAKKGAGGQWNDRDMDFKSKPLLEPESTTVSHQHLVQAGFQEEALS